MNQNTNLFRQKWEEEREIFIDYQQGLIFEHYDSKTKSQIQEALGFWEFIRLHSSNFSDNAEMRAFLATFITHTNPFISTIAYIEMLPTKVWRKILWAYNVDFQSFESFLRRLKPDQLQAIKNNWLNLFGGKEPIMPEVFKKSLRDRIKYWFKSNIAQNLLTDRLNPADRYMSKSAWAYSLLGLDFGFGKYPEGINNDKEIEDRSIGRFLSVKSHINDFVVNQESGKYWLMYSSARKNFVWGFWKKSVTLRTHICPGFWKTLLLHLLFWIVSPLLFIKGVWPMFSGDFHVTWINAIWMSLGFLTPAWCALALLRILISRSIWTIQRITAFFTTNEKAEAIVEFMKGVLGPIAGVIIMVVVILFVIIGGFYGLRHLIEKTSLREYSIFISLIIEIPVLGMIASRIIDDINNRWPKAKWYFGLAAMISVVVPTCICNANAISQFFLKSGSWIASHWFELMSGGIIIYLLFISIRGIYYLAEAKEREYLKFSRQSNFGMIGLCAYYLFLIYHYTPEGLISLKDIPGLWVLGFVVIMIAPVLYIWKGRKVTEESVSIKEKYDERIEELKDILCNCFEWHPNDSDDKQMLSANNFHAIVANAVYDNELFMKLSAEKLKEKMQELTKIIQEVLSTYTQDKEKIQLLSYILPTFSLDLLKKLKADKERIKVEVKSDEKITFLRHFVYSDWKNAIAKLQEIIKAKRLNEEKILEKQQKNRKRREKISRIFAWIFAPFLWAWVKIANILEDLKNLWQLFNERCPSVNLSKPLINKEGYKGESYEMD